MSARYGDRYVSEDTAVVVDNLIDIESAVIELSAQVKRIADFLEHSDVSSAARGHHEHVKGELRWLDSRSD